MKEFFSIGEVSKLFNVKISALRYYDEIGLLKPEYKDEQTNYRYYSTQQFERLDTIKYLRALGLPINKLACRKCENKRTVTDKQQLFLHTFVLKMQSVSS